MNRNKYFEISSSLYDNDEISGEVYDAIIMNADEFCDDDDDEYGLPSIYAEIEYYNMDTYEMYAYGRDDDMNFLRYLER